MEKSTESKFWDKVKKGTGKKACWIWTGCKIKGGYGYLSYRGKGMLAHRLSMEFHKGRPVPRKLHVCHHCDNTSCVRPSHLYEGTQNQNMHDMWDRKRHSQLQGRDNGRAVLTEKEVQNIRDEYIPFFVTQKMLARKYKISQSMISCITREANWTHI